MLMFRGVKLEDPSVSAFRRELLTRWQRREAEAARAAAAAAVAAKGRRAQAKAAVSERARPAAAPSLFRPLRPGDRIVKLTTPMPTSTTPTTAPVTQGPASPSMEPVAAILHRRQTAVARMATWLRGDPGARPSAAAPVASAPATHTTQPAAPLPVAEIFARRQRTIAAARPWAARKES